MPIRPSVRRPHSHSSSSRSHVDRFRRAARDRRRSASRLVPLAVAIAISVATSNAEAFELGTPAEEHPARSAQNFALEVRVSPYYAAVDDEPGIKGTPFKDSFGNNPRLSVGLEFDWQVFRIPYVGTIGPGLGASTVTISRQAVTKKTRRSSGDDYSLTIRPVTLSAVLRLDGFWRDLGFPLVPYGKVGLGVGFWRATSTGATSKARLEGGGAVSGASNTWGTHLAVGLAFPLDVLDRGASRSMDVETGINNTYLYAEYYSLDLNGLLQSSAMYVGTATWAAGLTFEF